MRTEVYSRAQGAEWEEQDEDSWHEELHLLHSAPSEGEPVHGQGQLAFPHQSADKQHRNNSFHPGSDAALADLLAVPMRISPGTSTANVQQMLWLQVYPPSPKGYSKTYVLLAVFMAEV